MPKKIPPWLLITAVSLGLLAWFIHDQYYEERIRVMAELGRVGGITDKVVNGFDDVTYEVISAQFRIAGRPEAVIEIVSPQEGLVGPLEHLWLKRIGPWEFHEHRYSYDGAYEINGGKPEPKQSLRITGSIDVGSSGEYAGMLPFQVRDANDLVARYDELVRYFSNWPDETLWGKTRAA